VVAEVNTALASRGVKAATVNIHYLSSGLDVEVVLPASYRASEGGAQNVASTIDLGGLKRRLGIHRLNVLQELEISAPESAQTEEAWVAKTAGL
jgi:hypothetical protein